MKTLNYYCNAPINDLLPQKRSWKNYSIARLNELLSVLNVMNVVSLSENCNVQEMWNVLETWITKACDEVAPLTDQPTGVRLKNDILPTNIKVKLI